MAFEYHFPDINKRVRKEIRKFRYSDSSTGVNTRCGLCCVTKPSVTRTSKCSITFMFKVTDIKIELSLQINSIFPQGCKGRTSYGS